MAITETIRQPLIRNLISLFIGLIAALFINPYAIAEQVEEGGMAPAFKMKGLSGEVISTESIKGKVAILNFWATWCVPCRREMPDLERAFNAHKDRGLMVIGVNLMQKESIINRYLDKNNITFPIALDADGSVSEVYGAAALPHSVLIDKGGKVLRVYTGLMLPRTIEAWVEEALPIE